MHVVNKREDLNLSDFNMITGIRSKMNKKCQQNIYPANVNVGLMVEN